MCQWTYLEEVTCQKAALSPPAEVTGQDVPVTISVTFLVHME